MRRRRGSLDFDLPDADVILGETGDVVAIVKAVRNEAHRLIEEFMLAANEAVARHLVFVPTPALYRVHDRPDERKLVDLRAVLEPLGYDIPEDDDEVTPGVFQAILDQAEGKPEERFVSDLVLRAQKKALYSEECRGHYALAATYYAHFTSPIRRYPDLLVHRALVRVDRDPPRARRRRRPRGGRAGSPRRRSHCSERERRAESAEREARRLEEVRLPVEAGRGGVRRLRLGRRPLRPLRHARRRSTSTASSRSTPLEDDFYRYDDVEHRLVGAPTGRVFRLGDRLRVKLTRADSESAVPRLPPRGRRSRTAPAVIERAAPRSAPRGREAADRPGGRPASRQAARGDEPPTGAADGPRAASRSSSSAGRTSGSRRSSTASPARAGRSSTTGPG